MVIMPEKGLSASMNAKIIGSGSETIVLAHGYGGDQSVWDKVVPSLAQCFRILVFDWGFSGAIKEPFSQEYDPLKYASYDAFASDLIGLLDEINFNSTIFVGHSMSGMIGCIASIKRPDLFKRLVLLGASPRYVDTEDYVGGFKKEDIEGLLLSLESNYEQWASGFASLVVDTNDRPSVDLWAACLKRMRLEVALPLAKLVFYSDYRDILEKVKTPCTIIQTTNDAVVPNSVAYFMQEKLQGKTTVEMIECDGHFPQLTAHARFLEVLGGILGFEYPYPE